MEPTVISIFTVATIVTGLTQVLKMTKGLDKYVEGREQIIAIVLALIIGVIGGLDILSSIVAGLSSMGLYDGAKGGVEAIKNRI